MKTEHKYKTGNNEVKIEISESFNCMRPHFKAVVHYRVPPKKKWILLSGSVNYEHSIEREKRVKLMNSMVSHTDINDAKNKYISEIMKLNVEY